MSVILVPKPRLRRNNSAAQLGGHASARPGVHPPPPDEDVRRSWPTVDQRGAARGRLKRRSGAAGAPGATRAALLHDTSAMPERAATGQPVGCRLARSPAQAPEQCTPSSTFCHARPCPGGVATAANPPCCAMRRAPEQDAQEARPVSFSPMDLALVGRFGRLGPFLGPRGSRIAVMAHAT